MMRESGMSMVELLVSLALISVVFLAAGPLIVQSIRVFNAAGRNLTDPDAVLTGAWLRQDVHSAYSASCSVSSASDQCLNLLLPGGVIVSYEQSGSFLVRKVVSHDGRVLSRQKIIPRLRAWSCGAVQGVVYVRVVLPSHLDPGRAALFRDPKRLSATGQGSESFCFSIRGRGRNSW